MFYFIFLLEVFMDFFVQIDLSSSLNSSESEESKKIR